LASFHHIPDPPLRSASCAPCSANPPRSSSTAPPSAAS
jgi:hypothetical protein